MLARRTVPQSTGVAFTVRTRISDALPAELLAVRVTLAMPATVGVPEITPVRAFTDSPAGNGLAL